MIGLLLAAATLASAAPAPAPGPDAASVSVSSDIAAPGAAAQQRLHEMCASRGRLDVDGLLAGVPGRRDLEALSFGEARDLAAYSACRDLQGAADGCSALDGLNGKFSGGAAAACRALAATDRFIFAAFRGGDAAGACREMLKPEGLSGPAVDRGCAAVIAAVRAGNALTACPAARREKIVGPTEEDCKNDLVFWSGEPEACVRVKDPMARRDCRLGAALVAGLRAPARCAASPACQALTSKSPKACEGPREDFSRGVCARVAKSVEAEIRRQEKVLERQRQNDARIKAEAKAKERADAVVKAKAEAEAKATAAAKAKMAAKAAKPQYEKGQPMRRSGDVKDIMERLEKGLPIKPVKPAKAPAGDAAAPADEETAPPGPN